MTETELQKNTTEGPFATRTVIILVLFGIFAFASYFVLSAYAPSLRSGNDGQGHALSKGATGYAGLVKLLRDLDVPVSRPRGDTDDLYDAFVVYTPPHTMNWEDWNLSPYEQGLIVLPKWSTRADPTRQGWVLKTGLLSGRSPSVNVGGTTYPLTPEHLGDSQEITLEGACDVMNGLQTCPVGEIDRLQSLSIDGQEQQLVTVLTGPEERVVLTQLGYTGYYVLSEPDLLNNHGLADPVRAVFSVQLVDSMREDRPVIFDLSAHGFDAPRNLLTLTLAPPFLAATICILLAGMLLGLRAAVRFGDPDQADRIPTFGKKMLTENSARLIRMARRETAFGARYVEVMRARFVRSIGKKGTLSDDQIDRALSRDAAEKQPAFSEIAASVRQSTTPEDLTTSSRHLHDLIRKGHRESK